MVSGIMSNFMQGSNSHPNQSEKGTGTQTCRLGFRK